MRKLRPISPILIALAFVWAGCTEENIFQPIPLDTASPTLAQPISLVVDDATERGYLVNSDNTVNYKDASLLILDLSNPESPVALNAVSIPHFSGQAYLDGSTDQLYIANRLSENSSDSHDQILRVNVDEATPEFLSVESFAGDADPFGLVSDGTSLYSINRGSVARFTLPDLEQRTRVDFNPLTSVTNKQIHTLETREGALSPSGNFLFVTNRSGRLLILRTSEITAPHEASPALTSLDAEPVDYVLLNTASTRGIASDGEKIYVVEGFPASLKILSEEGLPLETVVGAPQELPLGVLEIAEIPLGENPNGVAVDAAQNRAYVALTDEDALAVIDTQLQVEIARISLKDPASPTTKPEKKPFSVSIAHKDGVSYIYVLNQKSSTVSIVNGDSLEVVGNFPQ